MKVRIIHAPENYFQLIGTKLSDQFVRSTEMPDLVHLFAENFAVFKREMKTILVQCRKNTSLIIWVSWYKKSSGKQTDLSEDQIRDFALAHQLVDIKVCAVSNDWSGLKLVVSLAKR